jgi:hypothetical protein
MTTQDLKNNRDQILETMEFLGVHLSMKRRFMQTMVNFVEHGLNESEDVERLVYQIFHLNALRRKEWKGQKLSQATLDREYLASKSVTRREEMKNQGKHELEINRSL